MPSRRGFSRSCLPCNDASVLPISQQSVHMNWMQHWDQGRMEACPTVKHEPELPIYAPFTEAQRAAELILLGQVLMSAPWQATFANWTACCTTNSCQLEQNEYAVLDTNCRWFFSLNEVFKWDDLSPETKTRLRSLPTQAVSLCLAFGLV